MLPATHYAEDIYGNGTLRLTSDGKSVAYVSRENGLTTCGSSHLTVPAASQLQTSSRRESGHSDCRRMERTLQFCAVTTILTSYSCKNPNPEATIRCKFFC